MIKIKTEKEIEIMRTGGRKLFEVMEAIKAEIFVGQNTLELDKLAEELIFFMGGKPAFKGYGGENGRPFPATICASMNSEVVHGIPGENKIIKKGDILKIDIGMEYKKMFTDMARTFVVGDTNERNKKLIEITEQSFWEGIKNLKAGKKLSDYSKVTQKFIEKNGFSVVRNLTGHGIGDRLHEDPFIPNYYNKKYQDSTLASGMTLALEPMVNAGKPETILGNDGWTFKTKDGSMSAHYENTILITETGVEVLTILE